MIRSMTGYGKAEIQTDKIRAKVEIKTLNGKFIEVNLRTPRQLSEKEIYLRNYFSKNIVRGSVLAIIQIERISTSADELAFNKSLAKEYYKAFKELAAETGASEDALMASVLTAPEVMASREDSIDPKEWQSIQETCEAAFKELDAFRKKEGENLRSVMIQHCEKISSLLPEIEEFEAERKEKMIVKIRSALQENMLTENYDANRLEQELIYYLEKLDIAEEKNRLTEHCKLFMEEIKGEVSGKKLGFISQEMGREINTMGSKANFAAIQKIVVNMKEELEKIKEQSFNIL
jgi:uncharacterized protein (TIGR00255 family)